MLQAHQQRHDTTLGIATEVKTHTVGEILNVFGFDQFCAQYAHDAVRKTT